MDSLLFPVLTTAAGYKVLSGASSIAAGYTAKGRVYGAYR